MWLELGGTWMAQGEECTGQICYRVGKKKEAGPERSFVLFPVVQP